jgi:hypothetical protein
MHKRMNIMEKDVFGNVIADENDDPDGNFVLTLGVFFIGMLIIGAVAVIGDMILGGLRVLFG